MSTLQKAIEDKQELEAYIAKLIFEYQQKYPGLTVEAVSIVFTKVSGHPPVQSVESTIKITQ